MLLAPTTKLEILKRRAHFLKAVRTFFEERGVLEVDCSAIVAYPPIDSQIDVIEAFPFENQTAYLHTSPEYAMKRLLSQGLGDQYFLGHVFRKGEKGKLHQPEFTMIEWYRVGFTFQQMIEETADLLRLFLGPLPLQILPYADAFQQFLTIDPETVSQSTLLKLTADYFPSQEWDRKALLHLLLTHRIEPQLGVDCLTALIDYPPSEAALAQTTKKQGRLVAERFEIYHRGVELTNGYHESPDAEELRRRFTEDNLDRQKDGKQPYPVDEEFLASLGPTFPDCCGVAVGFDRAFALSQNLSFIQEGIANPFLIPQTS